MPLRASLENQRCGLSPSEAPTVSAADTLAVCGFRLFVAQASYPAPLLTTTCASCRAAMSAGCGSKSCASTAVVSTMEVTATSSPPICAAREPHWLTEATTVIGPAGSAGGSTGSADCLFCPQAPMEAMSPHAARTAAILFHRCVAPCICAPCHAALPVIRADDYALTPR